MLQIIRNRPEFLSPADLNDAASLLAESGLVSQRTALSRIKRQFMVLLGRIDGKAQATLTIKQPDLAYVESVFRRANVVRGNHSLELGYLYAKKGSAAAWPSVKMYAHAMVAIKKTNTGVYAVTRADAKTLNAYLARGGWFASAPFKSEKGDYSLVLWTQTAQTLLVKPEPPVTRIERTLSSVSAEGTATVVSVPTAWSGKRVVITLAE